MALNRFNLYRYTIVPCSRFVGRSFLQVAVRQLIAMSEEYIYDMLLHPSPLHFAYSDLSTTTLDGQLVERDAVSEGRLIIAVSAKKRYVA
jgi:hypothetical protein